MFNKEDFQHYTKLKDYITRASFPLKAGEGTSFEESLKWLVGVGNKMKSVNNALKELHQLREEKKELEKKREKRKQARLKRKAK